MMRFPTNSGCCPLCGCNKYAPVGFTITTTMLPEPSDRSPSVDNLDRTLLIEDITKRVIEAMREEFSNQIKKEFS